ncbi:Anaerobic regulatory protein [compost metagenome]
MLLALSERFGVPGDGGVLIDLKLTNDDLAAIAGVSRQFINSTLQDLRKRGLIAGRRHNVVITRPDRLQELAHHA